MTNITQHVIPRLKHYGIKNNYKPRVNFRGQTGSITESTVTVSLAIIAIVGVSLLGFFYLQQVFGTASQGTDIRDLENQITELKETQHNLELEGAQLRSLQTVEERVQELNLVESKQVSYLVLPEERVALSR